MDRHESPLNAASLWVFHFVGTMLVVGAMLLGMASVLRLTGDLGDGEQVAGVFWLGVAIVMFSAGRRLGDAYRIHPRSR